MAFEPDNVIPFDEARRIASPGSARPNSADGYAWSRSDHGDSGRFDSSRAASSRAASGGRVGGGVSGLAGAAFTPEDLFGPELGQSQSFNSARDEVSYGGPRAAVTSFDPKQEDSSDTGSSKGTRRRDRRAKAKADRMFQRQFGDMDASADSGPRAAVYEGKMGRLHKQAFEDLSGGKASSGRSRSATGASASAQEGFLVRSGFLGAPWFAVIIGVLAVVAALCLFLYPTAQTYYLELRETQRLQAEYDALQARNQEIQQGIDYLGTDDGVEDAAREQLGWVMEGETPGVVVGLSDDEGHVDSSDVEGSIVAGSIPAPQTWYSPLLDGLFGYDPSATVTGSGDSGSAEASSDSTASDAEASSDGAASDANSQDGSDASGGDGA